MAARVVLSQPLAEGRGLRIEGSALTQCPEVVRLAEIPYMLVVRDPLHGARHSRA